MNSYRQRVAELGGQFVFYPEPPPLITESDLLSAEREIGYPLPPDYREFLRDFGGYSFGVAHPIFNGPEWLQKCEFGVFYGLKIGSSYGLIEAYRNDLENMVIAPELLPIICNQSGSQVCLFLEGEKQGSVHYWLGDEVVAPFDYRNLYFVANSFGEFIDSLLLCE